MAVVKGAGAPGRQVNLGAASGLGQELIDRRVVCFGSVG
jgi:hypothetical protein